MAGLIAGLGAFLGGAFAVRKAEQEIDDLVSDKNEAKATRKAESVGRQLEDTNAKLRVKHEVERERRDQRRLDMRYKHGLDTHASSSSSSSSSHGRAQRGSSNDAGASVPNTVEFEVSGVFGKSWKKRHAKVFCDYLILSDSAQAKVPSDRIPLRGGQPHLDTADSERRTVRLTTAATQAQPQPITYRFRCTTSAEASAFRHALQPSTM